jgi:2-keto-3-deoxy-L-rhamnonate aldolase RhmA
MIRSTIFGVSALTSAKPAPLNRLRQLWREGRPTFGAIATIPSIQTVQIMARSGMDWIIVDSNMARSISARRMR